ncbi:hypothetical protein [Herbidospora sp. RD11066]
MWIRWPAAVACALFPTLAAHFGSTVITITGFYWDMSVLDGIGFFALLQGLGIGYLGSTVFDVAQAILYAEMFTIAFALPALLVAATAFWRNPRFVKVVAGLMAVFAVANLGANVVTLFLDPCQEGALCMWGAGNTPFFLYALGFGLAAAVLTPAKEDITL